MLKYSAPAIHVRRIVAKESKVLKYTPLKLDLDPDNLGSISPPPAPNVFRINSPIFGVDDFSNLPRVKGFSLKSTPTNKTKTAFKNRQFFKTAETDKKPKVRKNNYLHEVQVPDPEKDGWSWNLGSLTELSTLLKQKGAMSLKQLKQMRTSQSKPVSPQSKPDLW